MTHFLLKHEPFIRAGFFLGVLLAMAIWERTSPRRPLQFSRVMRWATNLGMVAIGSLSLRFLSPWMAVNAALGAESLRTGFFYTLDLSYTTAALAGIIILDFTVYLQHVIFHAMPALFRVHMMHHTDLDFDTTTGVRFHPIEILLSMGIKTAVVFTLGIPVWGVIVFEVLLNATSLFNHGNVRLGQATDRLLRFFLVTPDMHRVHHSVIIRETNSNFGFNLPWWDRLFGTYHSQPAAGHEGMTIGLSHIRNPKRLTLPWLLLLPFIEKPGKYPLS